MNHIKTIIKKVKYPLIVFHIFLFISMFAVHQKPLEDEESDSINVIVSILPQKEFVEKVGGDNVIVHELIHPGESPATYSPTIDDLKTIEKADIYFRIGYIPFEKTHLGSIKDINPNLKVIDIPSDIELRHFAEQHSEHSDNTIDQHLWLSISNVKKHVTSIATELSKYNSDNKEFYNQNTNEYIKELDLLDIQLAEILGGIQNKNLLVFHPSWGYFTDAYGLTQIAIEHEGHDPTVQQLAEVIDLAKAEQIRVIFVQEQFSRSVASSVASEIDGVVISIDPLAKDYLANMQTIADELKENL